LVAIKPIKITYDPSSSITVGTRIRFGDTPGGYETGVVVEVLDSPITGEPRAFVVRPDAPVLETVAAIVGIGHVVGVVEENSENE